MLKKLAHACEQNGFELTVMMVPRRRRSAWAGVRNVERPKGVPRYVEQPREWRVRAHHPTETRGNYLGEPVRLAFGCTSPYLLSAAESTRAQLRNWLKRR